MFSTRAEHCFFAISEEGFRNTERGRIGKSICTPQNPNPALTLPAPHATGAARQGSSCTDHSQFRRNLVDHPRAAPAPPSQRTTRCHCAHQSPSSEPTLWCDHFSRRSAASRLARRLKLHRCASTLQTAVSCSGVHIDELFALQLRNDSERQGTGRIRAGRCPLERTSCCRLAVALLQHCHRMLSLSLLSPSQPGAASVGIGIRLTL